jgi:hypothetical protein
VKLPHLVRVAEEPAAFAPLAAALAAAGLRLGWLEWRPPSPLPPSLTAAAGLGALRAVAVGGGTVAAVKPLAGPPVLADLVRGHFLGCALVLVAGEDAATARLPSLATEAGGGYRLHGAGGERRYDPAALAARLRSPRPLAAASPATHSEPEPAP